MARPWTDLPWYFGVVTLFKKTILKYRNKPTMPTMVHLPEYGPANIKIVRPWYDHDRITLVQLPWYNYHSTTIKNYHTMVKLTRDHGNFTMVLPQSYYGGTAAFCDNDKSSYCKTVVILPCYDHGCTMVVTWYFGIRKVSYSQ